MSEPEGKEESGNTILAYTTRGLTKSVNIEDKFLTFGEESYKYGKGEA